MTKRIVHCLRTGGIVAAILFFTAGCAFTRYKNNAAEGLAKPDNYPIPVYTEQMKIPRPCELIGTVTYHAGKFTMFGSSSEKEMAKILKMAREKGADIVRITNVAKPDFANPNYRLTAQLLRYTDIWEVAPFTRRTFEAYLNENRRQLDPIEGEWLSDIVHGEMIGIARDNSKPGREFIGFVLESANPAWTPGMKKIDIRRGPQPDSYVLTYYLNDFSQREVPLILTDRNKFAINIYTGEFSDNQDIVTYIRFQ